MAFLGTDVLSMQPSKFCTACMDYMDPDVPKRLSNLITHFLNFIFSGGWDEYLSFSAMVIFKGGFMYHQGINSLDIHFGGGVGGVGGVHQLMFLLKNSASEVLTHCYSDAIGRPRPVSTLA